MKKNTKKLFIFLTISLLYLPENIHSLFAQTTKVQNKKESIKFLTSSFDLSLNQINANFLGHNLKELYNRLQSRLDKLKTKGEFETSEEYSRRQSEEASKPIIGKVVKESNLAFIIKKCPSIFDADIGSMKVVIPFSIPSDDDLPLKYRAIQWKSEEVENNSYVGTNAFGATVDVSKEETRYYNLVVSNPDDFNIDKIYDSIGLYQLGFVANYQISATEAKKVKSKIISFIVCKFVPPFVSRNRKYNRATFDYPHEETYDFNYVHVSILELWFVDSSTGTVFWKVKANHQE